VPAGTGPGDLTRRYLHGLAAHSTWSPGAPLTLRPGSGPAGPPSAGPPSAGPPSAGPPSAGPPSAGPPSAGPHAAGQLTGQILRADPPRQLSYLLQSGPHDPPTFLTWQLRVTSCGTTLRLQIDEIEGSSDAAAEDTWLPVLAALRALLDAAPSRANPATGEQPGPMSANPIA
jgi:hypothetical protein